MNRKAALNLLVHAAIESIQQWARDIKGMRLGILIVIHTYSNIYAEIVTMDPKSLDVNTDVMRF
jgi:hypothetical protein